MEDRRKYQQERKNEFATNFIQNNILPVYTSYQATSSFKSLRRAIRRGHVDLYTGMVFPRKPFNNRKPTLGRKHNELKKNIYAQYLTGRV